MAMKIAETMMTLAEDNRDIKTSLRLMLKYEVQHLLERLKELGDESLLLLGNPLEGTSAKLGTSCGANFLQSVQYNLDLDLKNMFLKFCSDKSVLGSDGLSGPPGNAGYQQNYNQQGDGFPQQQQQQQYNYRNVNSPPCPLMPPSVQQPCHRFSPYSLTGAPPQTTQNPLQLELPNFWNNARVSQPLVKPRNLANNIINQANSNSSNSNSISNNKRKRNVCRHFMGKGLCWQGPLCSFLHTRDPQILASLGIDPNDTTSADSKEGNQAEETTAGTGSSQIGNNSSESAPD